MKEQLSYIRDLKDKYSVLDQSIRELEERY
jgi:hypothetical protein